MARHLLPALVLATIALAGCASRQVTRVDPATPLDLSGRWNDTDSRLVAEAMIDDAFSSAWLEGWRERPVIIFGPVQNETLEHIPIQTFLSDIERALTRSGRVVVVAAAGERDPLRRERSEQQEHARPSTRAHPGAETGADLMLAGVISSIEDREGGKRVYYYQVDLSLTELETNEKVWLGQKKLKKVVGRGRYKA